eukprot:Opistho-1_new@25990
MMGSQAQATPQTPRTGPPVRMNSVDDRKRKAAELSDDESDDDGKKRGRGSVDSKLNKGLRHFSMKVCEKVKEKGRTTYNEVADELVAEFSRMGETSQEATPLGYDQKNIRRRVYDALNVLMAMNIISKEKKDIKWIGLPTNSAEECKRLEAEKVQRNERLRTKRAHLQELILQEIAFRSLVDRNRKVVEQSGGALPRRHIPLPFIIVNTPKDAPIDL